ncbi:MAG: 1-deoxy-D-xylulose-5-phosphate reductoisomerase [Candidatus Omnitrophota bacterium]
MKKIAILGSTGSVGTNALDVIARHKGAFRVVALTANRNAELLARQANRFKPRLLALGDVSRYNELKRALKEPRKVLKGLDGVSEVASMPDADIVIVAVSGTSGILPLVSAIRAKKRIALANKESVVSAGSIIMNMARTRRVQIIPVDSEHNSIFQCINGKDKTAINKIFLMGTGGPLKNVSKSIFDKLKPRQVLAHPVWKMGRKISVDSATMMNKGLEVIEASHLFGISTSKIEVLLHPEAIIHSMVEFNDGNLIANLFYPDMKIPIFYALSYPERVRSRLRRLDFSKIKNISFQKPNLKAFPALGICYEAAKKGGTYPACLNSANEEAVQLYLEGKIKFTAIVDIVKKVLSRHRNIKEPSLDEILYVDREAREEARGLC